MPLATTNKLTDFDMALSLSEASINDQLRAGWKVWKRIRTGSPDKISVDGLDLVLGYPTISLDTQGAPNNRVRMSLKIESATQGGKEVARFLHWKVHFFAHLDRRTLSTAQLYQFDSTAADQVEKWEREEDVGAGGLSIEALLMTLAKGQCTLEAPPEVTSFSMPDEASRDNLLDRLETWLGSDVSPLHDKLVLNCVVYPAAPERPSTFTLCDYAFKITDDHSQGPSNPLTRTLDYLGVFTGPTSRPMLAGDELDAARGKLGPWYEIESGNGVNSSVAGLMVLRGRLFQQHMHKELQKAFEAEARRLIAISDASRTIAQRLDKPELDLLDGLDVSLSDRSLRLSNQKMFRFKHDDIDYALLEWLDLSIIPQPGNAWSVKGMARIHLERKRKVTLFESEARAASDIELNGSLTFDIENKGLEYSIKPVLRINAKAHAPFASGEPDDFIRKYVLQISNDYDVRRAREVTTRFSEQIALRLEESFGKVQVTLDNMAFVPPGEKVFAFRNVRFSEHHDLMLDVMYVDVTIPRQSFTQGKGTTNKQGR
ncbi:hypothetical protein [Pseudomonas putida]|uniref:Uncharacterized protein n=1 Tax=Pseudomonas putida TaxID=303 RepID=A0A1Q9RAL3_PSEPU|nr:hypothetical protein [Pseudomonas putida]OLS64381.1 hypothetical protein PSEMO_06660 [Pseudomonas putida]